MKDSWALVTGASAGFGWAICHQLAAQGVNLLPTARRADRLQKLQGELKQKYKVEVEPLIFDVSSKSDCERIFKEKSQRLSQVSILINNAGLAKGTESVAQGSVSDWEQMIDTNIKGLLYMTRQLLPQMIEKKQGHIVNIGSVSGRWVYPGGAVYCATKHAVRAISEGLRMDLMEKNIRVTNIEPGAAETEFSQVRLQDEQKAKAVYKGMTPLSPEDVAEAVLWSLQRPAHVNIQELVIFPTEQAGVGPSYTHRN
jgi:NADP-dependent 3-hydroxy acid dehydrogenase YdfG